MNADIIAKAGRLVGKVGLQLKKHSPEICMVAGIAGGIVSTVLACKATTKVDEILEPAKKTIDIVRKNQKGVLWHPFCYSASLTDREQCEYAKNQTDHGVVPPCKM